MKKNTIVNSLIILVVIYLIGSYGSGYRERGLPLAFPKTTADNNIGLWYEWSEVRSNVQKLVDKKDFDQLENMVNEARTQKLKYKTVTWVLHDLYNAIPYSLDDYEDIHKFADEWRKHSPESNIPDIIQARAFKFKAWDVRSGHYSSKVSGAQYQGFKDYLAKSWNAINEAEKKGPIDPEICTLQTELLFALYRDKKSAKERFYECAKIEPGYVHLYYRTSNYLQPKWYGSKEEWLQFVEESTDATKHIYGDGLYALLMAFHTKDTGKLMKGYGGKFSWNRTNAGFHDILQEYGMSSYILHHYGYTAMLARDYKVFAEVLKEIGTKWDDDKAKYYKKKTWYDFSLSRAKVYL